MTEQMTSRAPLGIKSRFASPILIIDASKGEKAQDRRARRFILQSIAKELLPHEKWLNRCMRFLISKPGEEKRAEVWYSPRAQRAHFKGLFLCASVWGCPVCGAKITQRSLEELKRGVAAWSGSIFMGTFTLQHVREDKLITLRDDLAAAFRSLKSGSWWNGSKYSSGFAERYGLVGSIVGKEITYSLANGHHPHLHVLFFSTFQVETIDHERIQRELYSQFAAKLEKQGRYVSAIYGVRIEKPIDAQQEGNEGLKQYISKWGLEEELVKSPVKKARRENGVEHYSPFQLLELYAAGKEWAGPVFREYFYAMKGTKRLRYSPGLRKLLELEVKEKTDEELAEEAQDIGDQLLASLTWPQWKIVIANDARSELLNIADTGDELRVKLFLAQLGVRGLEGQNYTKGDNDHE